MGQALVALLALGLSACTLPVADPEARPSAPATESAAAESAAPTATASPKLAPPKARLANAVAALRWSEPLGYDFVVSDSGAKLIEALGTWDPGTRSASLKVLIANPRKPEKRVGGRLVVIDGVRYGSLRNGCWMRLGHRMLEERLGLTDDTLGLSAVDALAEVRVTGVAPNSADVLQVEFELGRVMAMMGAPREERVEGRVPGEVTVLDGQVAEWTIDGADLAESFASDVPARLAKRIASLALDMEFFYDEAEEIRRPPYDKLAPNGRTPCPDATTTTKA